MPRARSADIRLERKRLTKSQRWNTSCFCSRMRSSFVPRLSADQSNPVERRILLGMLVVLAAAACYVLAPFWPAFLLALWTASMTRPWVERLARAIHGRESAAGVAIVTLILVLLTPIAATLIVVSGDAYSLAQRALASSSGRAALLQLVSHDDAQAGPAQAFSLASLDVATVLELFQTHGVEALTAASTLAGAVGAIALGTFVYLVATYAALSHGEPAYAWLEAQVPIAPSRLRRMRDAFTETGRGLLFSVALTGFIQGLVATVAYAALGVPRAVVLGFVTFLTSLIPTIGSALVWVPVSIGLWLSGRTTAAIILVSLGVIVISSVDNFLRPVSARWGKLELNSFLVLFSMLGGVLAVGGWGLVLGPLVIRMTLEALSVLREVQPVRPRRS